MAQPVQPEDNTTPGRLPLDTHNHPGVRRTAGCPCCRLLTAIFGKEDGRQRRGGQRPVRTTTVRVIVSNRADGDTV